PLHPLAEVKGEDPSLLDIEAFQQIGHQMVVRVIGTQLGIAIGHHVFDVLGGGEQRRELAAVLSRHLAGPLELGDRRALRQPLVHPGRDALLDGVGEEGRLLIGRCGKRAAGCEEEGDQSENRFHVGAGVLSTRGKYSCPGPIWAGQCIGLVKEKWKYPAWTSGRAGLRAAKDLPPAKSWGSVTLPNSSQRNWSTSPPCHRRSLPRP